MKKYIITEEQLNRLVENTDKPIKKGIALHITDDKGEYYESKLMSFVSDEEYSTWKENLDEGTKVIGEMDIEDDEVNLQLNENHSIDNQDRIKEGFKIVGQMIKRHYPFIIGLEPEYKTEYNTLIGVDVVVDLNKLYDVTNTTPPMKSLIHPHLLELLKDPRFYLMGYVDEQYDEMFGNEFNSKLEYLIKNYVGLLPGDMRLTKFYGYSGDDDFPKRWRNQKETINIHVGQYIPKVNIDLLTDKFSPGGSTDL